MNQANKKAKQLPFREEEMVFHITPEAKSLEEWQRFLEAVRTGKIEMELPKNELTYQEKLHRKLDLLILSLSEEELILLTKKLNGGIA